MHGDKPAGPIRWRMLLPVEREIVFRALSTDAGRASFWAESAVEEAGVINFEFANGEKVSARVLQSTPPARFSLQYFEGVASFDLSASSDGSTELLLTHEGVSEEHWNEVHAGWLNVLFPLKAMVVFGVDLRNHSRERSWNQGYGDQ